MIPNSIREHFESQADACERLGSPFTARLCRLLQQALDHDAMVGARVAKWPSNPGPDALALRLCGGLHHLVLTNADAELNAAYPPATIDDDSLAAVLRAAMMRNGRQLNEYLDSAPQTNEVARSGMLLPGFLTIARETR